VQVDQTWDPDVPELSGDDVHFRAYLNISVFLGDFKRYLFAFRLGL